jgi:hypothetical protein
MDFDQAVADRVLHELGQMVLADEEFAGKDWQGITLVIQVEPRKRLFGYRYRTDGSWEGATPDGRPTILKARELAEAMKIEGKEAWKACLVQISRPGPAIKVDFEYNDPSRWDVTPANLKARVEELRPR